MTVIVRLFGLGVVGLCLWLGIHAVVVWQAPVWFALLLLIVAGLIYWIGNLLTQAGTPQQHDRNTPLPDLTQLTPVRRDRLIQLLQGDVGAADRLIAHCRRDHPRQSLAWCVERCIAQLERDRRVY